MPVSAISYSQAIVLDSLPVYERSYQHYLNQKWTAERKEFTVVNKKKWWYYLPGIGWAFGLPTVNLNTGVLAQIDRDKSVMSARLMSLDARYQVEFVEQLARIRIEYRKLQVRSQQLERERLAMKRLYGIHAIYAEAFNSQTMTPEESLKHAYELDVSINQHRSKESELAISVLDFQILCRYQLPEQRLMDASTVTAVSELVPPRQKE